MVLLQLAASFSAGRWDHWLLIICFGLVATCGLSLSFRWKKDRLNQQAKTNLRRRLMRLVHRFPSMEQSAEAKRLK